MDLDEAAEELARRLGVPVVILDEAVNLVTYSAQGDDVDHAQLSIILSRRGTVGAIRAIRTLRVDRATSPVRLPPEGDVPAHMAVPLRQGDELLGYATFPDRGEAFRDSEVLAALAIAAKELGQLLALRRDGRRAGVRRERQLLGMLVSRAPEDQSAAASAILAEGLLRQDGTFTAAVFRPAGGATGGADRAELAEAVRSAARLSPLASICAVIGELGVAIFSRDPDEHLLQRLASAPQLGGVVMGLGEPRALLADVSSSHHEADIACRAALRDPQGYGRIARWRDLGWDGLLVQLPLAELAASDLPPAVARLLAAPESDQLVETIEAYLANRGNAMETAKRLNIHRSTLYYRLDQARVVTGSDLGSSASLRELDVGLRVAHLAGLVP